MKIFIKLFFLSLVAYSPAKAQPFKQYDLSTVRPATSVRISKDEFEARMLMIFKREADEPLGHFDERSAKSFCDKSIARLELFRRGILTDRTKIDEINHKITAPTTVPWGQVGTNCDYLGSCLSIRGNYDFTLVGIIRL